MRKIIIIAVLSIIFGIGVGWLLFRSSNGIQTNSERKISYYRDPMNPLSTSQTPKKAPDGMDFVPVYEDENRKSGERKLLYYHDPMHPWYTSEKPGKAPDCGMDLTPVYQGDESGQGIRIDPVTVQNIGVKTEVAMVRSLSKAIRTVGRVDFNETKIFNVNAKFMGYVEKLYVNYTGQYIHKGDPLMEIYSPDLVNAQQEFLQAVNYRKQMDVSQVEGMNKGALELQQSAKRKLLYWDIPESSIKELEESGTVRKTMTFYSQVEGVVVEKMVTQGQNIMAGMQLYRVADLRSVWILADIFQYELPWIKLGQQAEIELSYLPGKVFYGSVSYVYPTLNAETRTVKVRIEVSNTSALDLKPEMFTTVKIFSPMVLKTVAVPEQAIIHSGERNIVVISLGNGYFDPREVRTGLTAGGFVQIIDGVHEGEQLVTSAQFLIDSESNLKAAIHAMTSAKNDSTSRHEEKSMDMNKEKMQSANDYYTCTMHPEIHRDEPGDCPICGMKLVLKTSH